MTKPNTVQTKLTTESANEESASRRLVARLRRSMLLRETGVVFVFSAFTAILTWPYINYLRDVVVDTGDPYLVAWIFWWDYHQTFTDPIHLFNANVFYPLKYTLAFSEHSYGIALLFFPLYALGLRPLTVHAIVLFFGFALSGYGAFRLGRTLTGSTAVGWVAGIVFAFIPYRFNQMSQAVYLFSPWIPLVFEALVLFVRERSRKRAAWLGFAFLMNGLSTISWWNLSLIPLALATVVLLTRYALWRDRDFWRRGVPAIGAAFALLIPFFVPYVLASRLYGFKRSIEEIKANSAWPIHWLSVENRNRLWFRMGENITDGFKFKLFPGLLPILFSAAALLSGPSSDDAARPQTAGADSPIADRDAKRRWVARLDVLIVIAFSLSILATGFDRSEAFHGFFKYLTSELAWGLLTVAGIARLCLAYPRFLTTAKANLVETVRSPRHDDAFWLGLLLTVIGFCYSLGWNFFFYRLCYDLIPMFRSMRVVTRGAMIAYLGIALLAGLGVKQLAQVLPRRFPWLRANLVTGLACVLLLFELNAAPLRIVRGEVYPDAVTLRLKQTPMRGGIVELPAGGDLNYRYMLRAADHQKPLIVGTSGFNSPIEDQIEVMTRNGTIPAELMSLLEAIPTSYLVITNRSIPPERVADYQVFLARAVVAGRLRFINRFDGRDDLYAVVKNEPQTKTEASLPFALGLKHWDDLVKEDPVNILGQYRSWSQTIFRFYIASYGQMPRYSEFLADVQMIGRGVIASSPDQQANLEANLGQFADGWVARAKHQARYQSLTNEQFVDELAQNAGVTLDPGERRAFIDKLSAGTLTRAQVLLGIVNNQAFVAKEEKRSLVLLHYFGYLRRNPDDPPDNNLNGFNFWLRELELSGDPERLPRAFMVSGENKTTPNE